MATSTFSASVGKFCKKAKLAPTLVLRKLAFDGLRGVMLMSPVDTGRFRASWQVGVNRVQLAVAPEAVGGGSFNSAPPPISGSALSKMGEGNSSIAQAKFGDTIYITNNLPYAGPLERGSSKQAPNGMLRVTFERLKQNLDAAIKSAGKG